MQFLGRNVWGQRCNNSKIIDFLMVGVWILLRWVW